MELSAEYCFTVVAHDCGNFTIICCCCDDHIICGDAEKGVSKVEDCEHACSFLLLLVLVSSFLLS